MAPSYFPLRWESTGDQWWYASPIDWAAANGLYDLVTELLHLDTNLLIKLTSLRRIRRLETVWDDEAHFQDVAKCRSYVARKLLLECETARSRTGHNHNNSLFSAGYGGWLLYTAASAGDVGFVKELLGRDPLLVFGEREYGVTDMLYAAARGKNSEVFNNLLDSALLRKDCISSIGKELDEGGGVFKRDMVNRAIHAAARGGNWEILKQLLGIVSHIVSYRDAQGCTVLHAAAGRGQVEVVKNLIVLPDIINSTDAQGNTALHVASYRGYLPVVEILIQASPLLTMLTNHNGDTFLHMAVYGFRSPGFCRLDKHTVLMKQLLSEKIVNMKDIINVRNNDGRTALHLAVIHDVKCDVVESLMSVPSIDLNIRDADGMTPLDHLKQRPKSTSSEVLIKQLISAGGISNCQDYVTRNALVTHLKTHGIGGSPGTSFRISDAEIFLYTGIENSSFDANNDLASVRARLGATIKLPSYDLEVTGSSPGNNISACASKAADIYSPETPPGGSLMHSAASDNDVASVESNSCSIEVNNYESANSSYNSKSSPANYAAKRLKNLLQWPKRRETKAANSELEDDNSVDSFCSRKNLEDFPTPLRQRYSKQCSLPNNKRTLSIRTFLPSPSAKKYFTASLMQGVIKVKPHVLLPFQGVSNSSHSSDNKQKHVDMGPSCSNRPIDDGGTLQLNYKQSSFNKKLMNRYFSFGAQG